MIEGNTHRCHREIVLLLVGMGQPLREFTRALVVDVDDARHTLSSSAPIVLCLDDAGTHEVAHRLRSVLIAARLGELVDLVSKLVVDRDGDPLHQSLSTKFPIAYALSYWTSYSHLK